MAEKLYEYQGCIGRLHQVRDDVREKYHSWKESHPGGFSGWLKEHIFERKQSDRNQDFSHIYRRKSKKELVRVSAAVMGIEFSYAAETAFVSPTLLKIGVEHKHMTLVWALSPLIGFFLTPILGSLSDRLKRLFPNDQIKLQLLKAIKADTPILIPFRKWELHMLPSLTTGATNEIWAVKTSSFLESPRYCIVCFQTDHDLTKVNTDPTIFNHANITNITLTLNGESYPKEKMQLAFDKGAFPQAYFNYTQFGYSYKNTSQHTPLLGYPEFANKQPLFVIDCSRRDESVKSSTVDVKLEIEASQGFPANTRAYCIIIHDNIIEHLPLSEIIKKWN
ncbi:unnamed protein product [Phaedon cochleariae]|uniref:Double jelly roll-like domain-containing protein n=1 Tax=Phaedon cochleariae TaxID=80249 RepID=A0A9N9X289_PHACE|nr:unnamed protein product [Phaedon cochleariae]